MTKTKIVALLSVVALLASLPLTVVLAQQPPAPPFRVVGTAMIDGEKAAEGTMVVAMVGDMEVGMDTVGMGGMFMALDIEGEEGAMVSFMLKMGEGDEAMEYEAMSNMEVMIGTPAMPIMLEAGEGMMVQPTAMPGVTKAPTKTAEQMMQDQINTAVRSAVNSAVPSAVNSAVRPLTQLSSRP